MGPTGTTRSIGARARYRESADDVTINDGTATIVYGSGTDTIHSLIATNALTLSGGTLTVSSTVMVSGAFILSGGTLSDATIQSGTTLKLTNAGGAFVSVTVASGATIDGTESIGGNDNGLGMIGGLTLNGVLNLGSANGSTNGQLYFATDQTLSGTGTVTFGGSTSNTIYALGNNGNNPSTLTIGSGITVQGGSGSITGYYGNDSIINDGSVNFGSGGSTLTIGGDNWSNAGTITATSATVNLGGSFTTAGLGTFSASGATVNLTGTLNNSGTTLNLSSGLGNWYMAGGIINGGVVASTGGATLALTSIYSSTTDTDGGDLESVTIASGVTIDGTRTDNYIRLLGGLTLNGTIDLGSANGNNWSVWSFLGTQALSGTGSIVFGGSATNAILAQDTGNGATATLTIASGLTLSGGTGTIGGYDSGDAVTSDATINFSGGALTLDGGNWNNAGTITDTSGTVYLAGSFTTAGLGTFNASGATVNLTGTLNNTGQTLTLSSGLGNWNLRNGTISGGTISGGSTLTLTGPGGILSSLTVASGTTIDATQSPGSYYGDNAGINGGMVLDGTLDLGATNGSDYAQVFFQGGNQTLSGTGTVTFGGSINNTIYAQGNNGNTPSTLTIGSGITVQGANGRLEGYYSNDSFINDGDLNFGNGGSTLTISGDNWSNAGTITDFSGTVYLTGSFTTAGLGTFNASGSTVYLTGTLNNSGATLALSSELGNWYFASGTINGGTISGTTLTLASGGTFVSVTIASGATIDGTQSIAGNDDGLGIFGGLTLNGALNLGSANGSTNGQLYFATDETLSGTGTVTFGGSTSNTIYAQGNNGNDPSTLTIGSGITVQGGSGSITGYYGNDSIINDGKLNFGSGGSTLTIGGDNWSNAGTITATGATVNLGGSFTTAGLGTFSASGATVNLTGTLNNANATLTLQAAMGGNWYLRFGFINGGTISSSDGSMLVLTGLGGALSGVTVASGTTIDATQPQGTGGYSFDNMGINGGMILDGTLDLGATNGSYYAQVFFQGGNQTLSGTGTVTFGGSANNTIYAQGNNGNTPTTLTIGSGITVQGGSGSITGYYNNDSIINDGKLNFGSGGSTLTIGGDNWSNAGTITATGATVNLGGSFTTAGLGTFSASGATVNLTGTLNNANATLTLQAAMGGNWYLRFGFINGGTISSSDGSMLVLTGLGGALSGVTVASGTTIDATQPQGTGGYSFDNMGINGGMILDGTLDLGATNGSYYAQVFFQGGNQTLSGTGTVTFGGSANNTIYAQGNNGNTPTTLTIGSGITIGLGNGSLKGYYSGDAVIFDGTYAYIPTQLVVTTQPPSTVTAGAGFNVTVTAENIQGTPASSFVGNVTIALTNPASNTLNGALTLNAIGGVATYAGLSLDKIGSGYKLAASSGSLTTATSNAISVTPGAVAQLVVSTQPPATVTAGIGFGFTVTAEDAEGNTATSFNGSETVALANNPGSSSLGGTLTATAASGLAAFSGLTLNEGGSGYSLKVSSSTLSAATTNAFINNGPEAQFTDAGSTLNLVLGSTAQLNIVSVGSTYQLTLPNGTWVGTNDTKATGAGLSTLTVTSAGEIAFNTDISISDGGSLGGDAIVFNNSGSSTYTNSFVISLTHSTSGAATPGLTFNGSSSFAGNSNLTVSVNGDIVVNSGASVTTNSGVLSMAATGTNAPLTVNGILSSQIGAVTLQAAGTLTIGSGGTVSDGTVALGLTGSTSLVNNGSVTTSGTLTVNSGGWYNTGTITVASGTLTLLGTGQSNTGTITATSGTVNLTGTIYTAALGGVVNFTGSSVYLGGTLNNSGTTLNLSSGLGNWYMAGGIVNGGVVTSTGGATLTLTSIYSSTTNTYGGDLASVTIASGTTIDGTETNNYIRLIGGLTLNGTIDLGSANGNYWSIWSFFGTQALAGTGSIVFGGSTTNAILAQEAVNGTAATLTIASGLTLSGTTGTIGSDESVDEVINDTTVTFSNGTLDLNASNWVNNGTITVTAGTLNLSNNGSSNSGTITATNGTVNLAGTLSLAGPGDNLNFTGSTVYLTGSAERCQSNPISVGQLVHGCRQRHRRHDRQRHGDNVRPDQRRWHVQRRHRGIQRHHQRRPVYPVLLLRQRLRLGDVHQRVDAQRHPRFGHRQWLDLHPSAVSRNPGCFRKWHDCFRQLHEQSHRVPRERLLQ